MVESSRPRRVHPQGRTDTALRIGRATIVAFTLRRTFAEVERFVLFIGYPHSGSSMVGSLLNAHPEMVISQEVDVLRYVRPGITRNQLFALVLDGDRRFEGLGRRWMGTDYAVANASQGHFDRLRVIGDKDAGPSARRLGANPRLLDRLRGAVGVPLRVLHISRNPFDNIASMARSRNRPLSEAVDRYGNLSVAVDTVRERLGADELFEVPYESITAQPVAQVRAICDFIGVEAPASFLEACTASVRPGINRSRDDVTWTPEFRNQVEKLIRTRPALRDYTFSD
jgi:hypothetical protein